MRLWFETSIANTSFDKDLSKKWFPCTKGGDFRRWYGNYEYVVNWENDGREIKSFVDERGKLRSRPQNLQINFTEELTWSSISSSWISFRYAADYFMYESKGPVLTPKINYYTMLGYLNSNVYQRFIQIVAPTLDYSEGAVLRVPYMACADSTVPVIVQECVAISRTDWDSFETSWDFQRHPLVTPAIDQHYLRLADCWRDWERACNERFGQLKANEEELNRIFIEIYGLQDELTPDVDDKDVTVRKADLGRDIRSLISYAVGCMLGRYSLDKPGLAFAGGNWQEWLAQQDTMSYAPDKDGILPITDDEYFYDDIVTIFVDWVKTVYGAATLEENLTFIANALGGKGSPREVIREYFLNDFYKDHLKIYQKRPIYWLFDSGKKNGFKALVYMHRWQPDTIARVRTDYVHEMQSRYRTAIADVEQRINGASTSERVKLSKRLTALQAQAEELRKYEEKVHHLADQMIGIDLDDGVKVNYAKFADVLAPIK